MLGVIAEVAASAAAEEGGSSDLGSTLMHKVVDANYIELYTLKVPLPRFEPLHIGPLVVDLSITKHTFFLLLAGLLSILLFAGVARGFRQRYSDRAPRGFAGAAEAFVVYVRNEIVRRNIGHDADGYTPFILTMFSLVLFMNMLGLIPYGSTATGNINVTAALALISFAAVEISGMRALGFKGYLGTIFYAPHGMGPVGTALMMVIMTPVEFLGKLTKPFALAIRLFANMTAGGVLLYSLLGLILVFADLTLGRWGIAGASVTMATAIYLLKIFVGFLQAYLFAMLTAVFIGLIRHAH